ncbi:ABC transporter permease [Paenibacillus solani]|uniref:ABC transporter permease n=1 Tax=Paenibacillus solani TaxID=1705565 RepID=UPI003D2C052F
MRSFGNLVWNEWLKMFKKRSFFLPYALLAGMVIFTAFMLYKFAGGGNTGYEFAHMAVSTKGMGQMLTLLAIVVTAGTVAKEHSMGTIKLLLIRAQSRSTILASKYVAVLLYLITLVAFMFAVAVLTGQITFGMDGGTVTLGDVLSAAVNNLVYTIVYVTLTFMVGILTRSTGPAIGIGMFIVIMESMVVQLLARYSWSKYLLFLNVDLSIYSGGSSSPVPGMSLTFSMIVLAVYLLLFLLTGFVTFKKRDVA